jgi:CHAD domain-containing protein
MTERGHFGDARLTRALRRDAKRFKTLAKKTARHPTPDHVHDLRVVTRRLRAELWLTPPRYRTDAIRECRRDLRQMARVLGEQRKYDVALEDARRFDRRTRRIEKRLAATRAGVDTILRAKRRKQCLVHLKQAIGDAGRIPSRAFRPRIEALRHRLERSERRHPTSTPARHRLRIDVKKARYVLEAMRSDVPGLVSLQDHLGRWHDLMVLSTLTGHPRAVVTAHRAEWRRVEVKLDATLRRMIRALAALSPADRRSTA